jgi:hypothetical protein
MHRVAGGRNPLCHGRDLDQSWGPTAQNLSDALGTALALTFTASLAPPKKNLLRRTHSRRSLTNIDGVVRSPFFERNGISAGLSCHRLLLAHSSRPPVRVAPAAPDPSSHPAQIEIDAGKLGLCFTIKHNCGYRP